MEKQLQSVLALVSKEQFLYPFMSVTMNLSDEREIKAAEEAYEKNERIFVANLKSDVREAVLENCYRFGVLGKIMRCSRLPNGEAKILFSGEKKAKFVAPVTDENEANLQNGETTQTTPKRIYILEVEPFFAIDGNTNDVSGLSEEQLNEAVERIKASHIRNIKDLFSQYVKITSSVTPEVERAVRDSDDLQRICDFILHILRPSRDVAYKFFENLDWIDLAQRLFEFIEDKIEDENFMNSVRNKVANNINKQNREHFIREQMRELRRELNEDDEDESDTDDYKKKLKAIAPHINEEAHKEIKKQISRLSKMRNDNSEANLIATWLDYVFEMPFGKFSPAKNVTSALVAKRLDGDHFGLEKQKKRIVEYFGLREFLQLREQKEQKGLILCFVGAPGVGKTSLANSIAAALGRKLVRVALGGVEDVNELRGHRRTYLGSMPGRIVQGIIDAGELDAVFVLDEIDKVVKSPRGDPAAALLELLDPEQNKAFRDHYLNFNIDLSRLLFIATANDASAIPPALRDRMEFVEVSSYTPQEKCEIAKRHLVPQELEKHGLKKSELTFGKSAVSALVELYTRESGVRGLRKQIASVCRKVANGFVSGEFAGKVSVTASNLAEFLEEKPYESEAKVEGDAVGVVNGLAWTSVGGEILKIESIVLSGKGGLQLTGHLGDVMSESAKVALSLAKRLFDEGVVSVASGEKSGEKCAEKSGDKFEKSGEKSGEKLPFYAKLDLCLHVPAGATPKDGPSAGIAMTTAIVSALGGKKVRGDVAMTGEVTLSGRVLAIGGLKEKLIAAFKAGVKTALIPQQNFERDLKDLPKDVVEGVKILPVKNIREVLKLALC